MMNSTAELAFHAARVALAGDALVRGLAVRLGDDRARTEADLISIVAMEPKPLRISGAVEGSELTLGLGSVADPVTRTRHHLEHDALSRAGLGTVATDAPDSIAIVVVAFDRLLRLDMRTWRAFMTEFWIDGPLAWCADAVDSRLAQTLWLPEEVLTDASTVVHLGYGTRDGFRYPFLPGAWNLNR